MSRGGVPAADVAQLCQRVADRATVTIHQGDVANPDDVERVMAALRAGPHPLGGIVHAAGTVNDMPLSAQTWETIDEVLSPKVYGTWLLHEATRSMPDLQFFVGYSSGGSVIGPPTQSNYAAANAFMDNLLVWRAARGLPGLSINWGPVGRGGHVARLSDMMIKRWDDEGVKLFTPAKGTRAMISLLGAPVAQVTAGECDWDRFVAARPVDNALYRLVLSGDDAADRRIDLEALLAAPAKERVETIGVFVRRKIADVLHMDDPDGVDAHTEFVQLGLDSLVAVELKNALESAFRIPLPASLAFDFPSAAALTEFLDGQLVPAQGRLGRAMNEHTLAARSAAHSRAARGPRRDHLRGPRGHLRPTAPGEQPHRPCAARRRARSRRAGRLSRQGLRALLRHRPGVRQERHRARAGQLAADARRGRPHPARLGRRTAFRGTGVRPGRRADRP
jgi:acyl carrier protein